MSAETPPPLPLTPQRKHSCLVKGLLVLALLALTCAGLWWWFNRPIKPVVLTPAEKITVEAKVDALQEPTYEKGSKEIVITERELNGLLNEQTQLGQSVNFQLGTNVVIARVETDLDPSVPAVGGKRLKARAHFTVGQDAGKPTLILDDVTVWGVSMPNDWLAGWKDRDLLAEILGNDRDGRIPGLEEFRVEPGRLIIRIAE